MSLAAFQESLARLVADPGFAHALRAGEADADLTPREQERLLAAASAPGLDAARVVHTGWRLGKLLGLLPRTRAALGDRFAPLATAFWASQPPRSLYFQREAIAFCRFVCESDDLPAGAAGIASFEAGVIELDLGAEEGGRDRVEIQIDGDAAALLEAPAGPGTLIGRRGADGAHRWSFVAAGSTSGP